MANTTYFKVKNGIKVEPSTTAADEAGSIRVDSAASNALKYYDGTSERTTVNTDQAQTLTNKTLTSPTINTPTVDIPLFSHQAAPSSPASGFVKLYFKNDDTLYYKNSGGTESTIATTAAVGADQSYELSNLAIAVSVAANAMTIALKGKSGSDPSGSNVVGIGFRSSTVTSGVYLRRTVSAALSVVVSSGSTLGFSSAITHYSYVYLIDNAGTVELAISASLYDEGAVISTSAEGGAGGADSNSTIYSTTARSNVPVRLIARLKHSLTTAGTWDEVPDEISLAPFVPQVVCALYESNTARTISNNSATTAEFLTEDLIFDTHNAFNPSNNIFTVPVAGKYRVSCQSASTTLAGNWLATEVWQNRLFKNGSYDRLMGSWVADSSATVQAYASGSTLVSCVAGDTLEVRIFQNSGTTLNTSGTAQDNWVSYERIGQ